MLKCLLESSSLVAISMLFALAPTAPSAQPHTATQLVILVRHAEKACGDDHDPLLSKRGHTRAEALVKALEHTLVKRIVTTEFKRTQATAAPLAQKFGIQPVSAKKEKNANHIKEVAEAVTSQRPATVLVVGHSDSVPGIIAKLKGPTLSNLPPTRYSTLFLAAVGPDGTQLVQARYGDVDPDTECQ
jgi:broad specificity phosphatase PhoE